MRLRRALAGSLLILGLGATASCGTFLVEGACGPADCCENNIKDGIEVDVDCGYRCKQKCNGGQHCVLTEDCRSGYRCTDEPDTTVRACVPIEGVNLDT